MTSRPLVFPVIAMIVGMLIEKYLFIENIYFWMIAIVLFLNVILAWRFILYRLYYLNIACICFGIIWMASASVLPQNHIAKFYEQFRYKSVLLQGVISSVVEEGEFNYIKNNKFILDLAYIQLNQMWHRVSGKLLVTSFALTPLQYGDKVLLEGKIFLPFEQRGVKTSYREYLKHRDIYFSMSIKKKARIVVLEKNQSFCLWRFSSQMAVKMKCLFRTFFSKEESAMLDALVLGDQKKVPTYIKELFAKTGAAHLLAVSGFNVGIMAIGAMFILKIFCFPWRVRFLLAMGVVVFYALLTGMMSAVVRAMVMGVILLLGYLFEREVDVFNSLALAALIILIASPFQLFDIGFQLSFSCVLALLICCCFWKAQAGQSRVGIFMIEAIGVTLAATIGSLGLSAYYFGYISPISLLSNIMLVPMIALITILGVCFLFFSWWGWIAGILTMVIKAILHATWLVVYLFSLVPGSVYEIKDVSLLKMIGFYACVGLFIYGYHIYKKS